MKKSYKRFAALAAVLALALALSVTAYAKSPAEPKKAIKLSDVEVHASVSVAGKDGDCYDAGDLVLVDVTVENKSDRSVSGYIRILCPAFDDHEVLAGPCWPVLEPVDRMGWDVADLEPGGTAEAVIVMRAPEGTDHPDWVATAYFSESGSRGMAFAHAEGHFGVPLLKADKSALLKDGILRVHNAGNGGASRVKFQFSVKSAWQDAGNWPDGAAYIGGGMAEIGLGGIAPGGTAEKDVSGLLHQRMDYNGDYRFVCDGDRIAEWD